MGIKAIRYAMATAVEVSVPADMLTCLGYAPDSIPEPCYYPHKVDIVPMPGMEDRDLITVTSRLLVSEADDEAGQNLLDEFLSRDGPNSVRAALAAARPLMVDGVPHDIQFVSITAYGKYLIGTTYYFGAELVHTVIGG
jgi:hypothetical protein